ncbi:hypothetical protein KAI87_17835, partial [Myxococcota bacterium]|nr:hypothetical protein [Myxococcota bacterium]
SCTVQSATNEAITLYVQFFDALCNPSEIAQTLLFADNTPPSGAAVDFVIAGNVTLATDGTFYANSQLIAATLSGTLDDASQMQISTDDVWDSELWVGIASTFTVELPPADCTAGVCTVYLRIRDGAGNVATGSSKAITLDTTPPTAPRVVKASDLTNITAYDLNIVPGTVADSNFLSFEILGNGYASFTEVSTDVTKTNFSLTLLENVDNVVRIRAIDKAGNISPEGIAIITHDSVPPVLPTGFRVEARDSQLSLFWDGSLSEDVAYYNVYYGAVSGLYTGTLAAEGPSPVNAGIATSVVLSSLSNGSTIYCAVAAVDHAGNQSPYSMEVSAQPARVAPKLVGQVGGPINNVWLDENKNILYVPSDGGLTAYDSATSDLIFRINDLPDVTQILFDGDFLFVHSSDPQRGPVSVSEDQMFSGLPSIQAPVRVLSGYRLTGIGSDPVSALWDGIPMSLPNGTAFFYMADNGISKRAVSGTAGTLIDMEREGDSLDFSLFASELSFWNYDASVADTITFSLDFTENTGPIMGWAMADKQHLSFGTYPVGNFPLGDF